MTVLAEPKYHERRLERRLINWGLWLNYQTEIGPLDATCTSIESRYQEDSLGEVMDDDRRAPSEIPDVSDAEGMQRLISNLDTIEQYALAINYGGAPCVMRWRRLGDAVMSKALGNAHTVLRCEIKPQQK